MPSLSTQIRSVTVYPDRARVSRAGTVHLEAGTQTVVISPLPQQLDESSVRASGKGSARLTGLELQQEHATAAAPGDAKAAQDKLQALQDQDRIFADEQDAWQSRLGVIRRVGEEGGENFARNLARGKLPLDGFTSVLDYLSQSHEAAATILRELAVRRRDLAREIEAAKAEADKLANAASREYHSAQVNLEVATAGDVEIEVEYTVYGASWQAVYDARLQDEQLEWNYLAQVQQQTGEDWALPYDLTLSTATLATGLDKPELPRWQIDVYRPPEPRMFKARAANAAAAMPAPTMMMAEAAPAMAYDSAQVQSSGPSVTYRITTPRAIPSDGEPHQVNITTMQLSAALDYFSAPKVDPHAFVRAKFTSPGDYVMLGGELSLYHGTDFRGKRYIEPIAPGQEVELFLGADERIVVERRETEHNVDKNLLGNTGRTNIGYRITVKNPTRPTAKLTVLDQIPVSQHPDIKVKLRDANPRPTAQNDQGELRWNLNLAQGGTAEITFAFTVEYPKELRVAGI